ncbi:MAG: hypothetical protein H6733_09915 [Alphaproteobacteria bacterium]|nr:hypothetical protein [Alphaproteobacteria bacterium]
MIQPPPPSEPARPSVAPLLVVPVVALLALGAVGPAERAVLHGLLAILLVARMRDGRVDGAARAVVFAALPLLGAMLVGLVPLPASVLAVLAPGIVAARPFDDSWTLSLRPERVPEAAATWLLLTSQAALLVAVAPDRRRLAPWLAWGTLGFALLGITHAAVDAQTLFGVVAVRAHDGRFFAPLVHPNHHGAVLLAGLPFVVQALRRDLDARTPRAVVWAALVAWIVAYPIVVASMGLVLALAAQGAVLVGASSWPLPRRVGVLAVGAAVLSGAAVWVTVQQPEWWLLSGAPRLAQWADTVPVVVDHPLAGVGAGAYGAAYTAYRTVSSYAVFEHAHADVLEWVAELGAFGLVAVAMSVPLWPVDGRGADRLPWTLALTALAVHGCVDFPWHVPGVALVGVVVAVGWGRAPRPPVWGPSRWLGVLVVAHVAAIGLLAQRAWVDHAVEAVHTRTADDATLDALERLAPWRPEPWLARLAAAPTRERATMVAHRFSDDGITLARVAAVMLEAGDLDAAASWSQRAVRRDPNDFRAWRLVAAIRQRQGDTVGAAEAWAEALRRWPRELLDVGHPFDDAFAVFPIGVWWLTALADAPAHWSVRLAWTMLEREDYDTALLACEQAGRLRPAAHTWMPACATALAGTGQVAAARDYLDRWTTERPEDFWAWVAVWDTLGRFGDASDLPSREQALRRAWTLRPGDGRTCRLLKEARAACGACTRQDPACTAPPPTSTCALAAWALTPADEPLPARPLDATALPDDDALWVRCP